MDLVIIGLVTLVIAILIALFLLKQDEKPQKKKVFISQSDGPKIDFGNLKIYYASQTGTAQMYANIIAEEAPSYGFTDPQVIDFAEFDPIEFYETDISIIIASTQGEGEPPDNAIGFYS